MKKTRSPILKRKLAKAWPQEIADADKGGKGIHNNPATEATLAVNQDAVLEGRASMSGEKRLPKPAGAVVSGNKRAIRAEANYPAQFVNPNSDLTPNKPENRWALSMPATQRTVEAHRDNRRGGYQGVMTPANDNLVEARGGADTPIREDYDHTGGFGGNANWQAERSDHVYWTGVGEQAQDEAFPIPRLDHPNFYAPIDFRWSESHDPHTGQKDKYIHSKTGQRDHTMWKINPQTGLAEHAHTWSSPMTKQGGGEQQMLDHVNQYLASLNGMHKNEVKKNHPDNPVIEDAMLEAGATKDVRDPTDYPDWSKMPKMQDKGKLLTRYGGADSGEKFPESELNRRALGYMANNGGYGYGSPGGTVNQIEDPLGDKQPTVMTGGLAPYRPGTDPEMPYFMSYHTGPDSKTQYERQDLTRERISTPALDKLHSKAWARAQAILAEPPKPSAMGVPAPDRSAFERSPVIRRMLLKKALPKGARLDASNPGDQTENKANQVGFFNTHSPAEQAVTQDQFGGAQMSATGAPQPMRVNGAPVGNASNVWPTAIKLAGKQHTVNIDNGWGVNHPPETGLPWTTHSWSGVPFMDEAAQRGVQFPVVGSDAVNVRGARDIDEAFWSHPNFYEWHDGHTSHHNPRPWDKQAALDMVKEKWPDVVQKAESTSGPFGTLTGTPSNLTHYQYQDKLPDVQDLVKRHGFKVYYAGGKYGTPDRANKNYDTNHLEISDPSSNDPNHQNHTDAWRQMHELAHALTAPELNSVYGEARRTGSLGQDRTLNEAQRAVHWEWLAAHKQRELSKQIGVHVPDETFHKELNTIMHDAVQRAVTGQPIEPAGAGFVPHGHKVPLQTALDMVREHASKMGLQGHHELVRKTEPRPMIEIVKK
jgi:hypothetical protein